MSAICSNILSPLVGLWVRWGIVCYNNCTSCEVEVVWRTGCLMNWQWEITFVILTRGKNLLEYYTLIKQILRFTTNDIILQYIVLYVLIFLCQASSPLLLLSTCYPGLTAWAELYQPFGPQNTRWNLKMSFSSFCPLWNMFFNFMGQANKKNWVGPQNDNDFDHYLRLTTLNS